MVGVTEKKKRGKFLLLHRSGAVVKTKTLATSQSLKGITAIINLDTLEQFNGENWEEIPDGCEILIAAEKEEEAYDDAQEEECNEEVALDLQFGAKRYFNPHVVWAYCRT